MAHLRVSCLSRVRVGGSLSTTTRGTLRTLRMSRPLEEGEGEEEKIWYRPPASVALPHRIDLR